MRLAPAISAKPVAHGTRSRLLAAASIVFADRGYHRATVRDICKRAEVNGALVNYHFGDKLELYTEVLRNSLHAADRQTDLQNLFQHSDEPEAQLKMIVRGMLDRMVKRRESGDVHIRLLLHELAQPTPAFIRVIDKTVKPLHDGVRAVLGRILELPPEHDTTRLCAQSIVGQVIHHAHHSPVIARLWPELKMTAESQDMVAEHIANFSLSYSRAAKGGVGPVETKPAQPQDYERNTHRQACAAGVSGVKLLVSTGGGLLGANGAGKTTTIKMLCGLLAPTIGDMQLAGERGSLRSQEIRQQMGYMSQKFSLYDDLSIGENLSFFGGVYGVPEDELAEKRRWVLTFSGLEGKEDLITGSLPGGWKQRVAFGACIMHEPSILFLDEPTSGVDPLARRAFWTMINYLADRGTAVLVTTHYLEEAEQFNRLGFMVAGELVKQGTPTGINQHGHLMEFRTDQPQRAADLLKAQTARWRVSLFGDRLHVISDDEPLVAERKTREKLGAAGIEVLAVHEQRFSLEDVFISTVEQAKLEGKVASED